MKRILCILLAVNCCLGLAWAKSKGKVVLHEDAAMNEVLYQNKSNAPLAKDACLQAVGYRIQFYSSNHARKAKQEAFQWAEKLKIDFPDQKTYITYQAPFWKVRMGDFSSYAEAIWFGKKVKEVYPELSNDIYVVKDTHTKPIYFNEKKNFATDSLSNSVQP